MLCDTFIQLARRTWEQMKRNHTTEILVREEAITGINLQELKIAHSDRITIREFTVHEESNRTGADWEWWFVDQHVAIGFAVQAKRLNNGSYDIGYKPKTNPLQIETLLRYCSDAGDITPLYCWYNYFPHELVESDAWGCALADGYSVYAQHLGKNYSLSEIQPISTPWHHLVCDFDNRGIPHILKVAKWLASNNSQIPTIALPKGIKQISAIVHQNGLPKRVLDMLSSKGVGTSPIQKDPPVGYPGRLVIVERQWPKSTRFD